MINEVASGSSPFSKASQPVGPHKDSDALTLHSPDIGPVVAPAPPGSDGLKISPLLLMVIVFVQAALLTTTAIGLTLIVTRPDIVQQLIDSGTPGGTAGRGEFKAAEVAPRMNTGTGARLILDVPRPIQVTAGQNSRLRIRILPPGEARGVYILTIKGLPDGSIISGAHRLGGDTWSLDASREPALTLTVPESVQGPFNLEVELRNPDGALVTSEITSLIVLPDGKRSLDPHRDAMAALVLLESARSFVRAGDVKSGRVLLQSSANRGNAQAALELGETFDQPKAGAGGDPGDPAKALYWFMEAQRLGHPGAEARMEAIATRSQTKQ